MHHETSDAPPPATRRWTEDWLAVAIGLLVIALALPILGGVDTFGWAAKTNVWTTLSKAVAPVAASRDGSPYQQLGGVASLGLTFLFLLVLMTAGARLLGAAAGRFALGFAVVFWL